MSNIFDLFRRIESPSVGPISYVVAGLGNPGAEYEGTRHNVGYLALDRIAERAGARVDRARFRSLTGEATVAGVRVLLLKPTTYMNLSGHAVREALSFYKLPPERLIVFCDDVSFDVGRVRIRLRGSHGGHNGLRSIVQEVGSEDFCRVKIGVGKKPRPDYDLADWVLGRLPSGDRALLDERLPLLFDALSLLVSNKAEEAMNRYST